MGVEFHVTTEVLPWASTPQTSSHRMEKLKGPIRRSGIGPPFRPHTGKGYSGFCSIITKNSKRAWAFDRLDSTSSYVVSVPVGVEACGRRARKGELMKLHRTFPNRLLHRIMIEAPSMGEIGRPRGGGL